MRTAGQFLQDTPFADMEIFLAPPLLGTNNASFGGSFGSPPLYYTYNTVSTSTHFYASVPVFNRLGTAPNYQEQFGTAALKPGPSSVSNTSDPLNIVGMPPTKKANLATLTGGPNGFVAKGMQVNYIDVIYQILTNPLASINCSLVKTVFANNAALVSSNIIAYAANGLQTAVQANPYVTRIPIAAPAFVTSGDTVLQFGLDVALGASATTFNLFGVVIGLSFNFN